MKKHAAVFIDRDGTIIEDTHYPRDPDRVCLLPSSARGLCEMRRRGYLLYVVSNQSGVGRGIIQEAQFRAVHERFCTLLKAEGVEIAEFAYCFHRPEDQCHCRKPKTGLIPRTFQGAEFSFSESFTVGDSECDLKLGDNLGTTSFLALTGKGASTQEALRQSGELARYRVCADLWEMASHLPLVSNL